MDSGISEMISGILSNPDALNKIMTLMPAVAQMMNGGGLNNLNNPGNSSQEQEKVIETTAAPANPDMSAENLMANEEVMTALKNLIAALNAASANNNNNNDAVMTSAFQNLSSMINTANNNQSNQSNQSQDESANNGTGAIEKTLDTLKNFSSATSPESDHRSKLLLALKPFLKDTRQTKIDTAIKYMNAAKIINLFGKNGFV